MAQTLCINEKEYLPSTQLAKRFSYTSDYISKLAREEKVLATRVGRQWFIEPESLHIYVQQLEIEKKIQKEKLSRQRKIERSQGVQVAKTNSPKTANALAQAFVVVLLGSAVGVLGWGVITSGLTAYDLARGATAELASIEDRLSAGVSMLLEDEVAVSAVASPVLVHKQAGVGYQRPEYSEVGPQFERGGVYTTFPTMPVGTTTGSRVLSEQVLGVNFSDDVLITEEDGGVFIQPVLRDVLGEPHQVGLSDTSELADE